MPQTFLRSATNRPVRYSAKWRRCGSLGNRSPKCRRASWTTVGKSMIPAMAASQGKDQVTQDSVQTVTKASAPNYLCKMPVPRPEHAEKKKHATWQASFLFGIAADLRSAHHLSCFSRRPAC